MDSVEIVIESIEAQDQSVDQSVDRSVDQSVDQENENQTQISSEVKKSLTLDAIDWKPFYVLSKSSIGQIMISFKNILKVTPKNIYETKLYGRLKPAVEGLIGHYNDILQYENDIEKDVKFYNLIVNLPIGVTINDQEDGNITMKFAKIGKLIKAARQRINFIETRTVPQMYVSNEDYLRQFNKMKEELQDLQETFDDFENEFLEAIDEAHKAQQASY